MACSADGPVIGDKTEESQRLYHLTAPTEGRLTGRRALPARRQCWVININVEKGAAACLKQVLAAPDSQILLALTVNARGV